MPAKSKQQQKFFGVVRAMQKGDIPKKGEAGKVADDMKNKKVKKMASTKHKGLPKKVKEMIARELVKELQLNEVKPFRDEKLVSQFHDKTKNIFYLATNDHRYPTEIVLWDMPKKQFIFIYGQMGKFTNSSPTERISANKLSKTHWVWPYHAGVAGNKPFPGETMQQKIARNKKGWKGEGINEASDKFYIKQLTDTFKRFKLDPRKYEIMMDSSFGAGSKIPVLRPKGGFGDGVMIDQTGSADQIELMSSKSGRPIPGKNKFTDIDQAMVAATKYVDNIKEAKLNEMDINDPILVAIRARKTDLKKKAALPKVKKISTKQYYKLMDMESDIIDKMKDAAKEYQRLDSEMNQDAGQKGSNWTDADANRYGGDLDKLQTKIEKLAKQKLKVKKAIMSYRIN